MFTLFHHFGVGLIEFTATLAVISILLYLATPTFSNLMTQYRLKAATETLYANLQLAKLSAIRKNKSLRIYFKSMNGGASWCYGLNENGSCDCSTANSCQVDNVSNTVSSYDYPDVSIELSLDNNVHDLVGEGFELGIHIGPLSDDSLVARPLTPYRRILAAAPDYLARHGRPVSPEALTNHLCLGHSYWRRQDRWHLVGLGGEMRDVP